MWKGVVVIVDSINLLTVRLWITGLFLVICSIKDIRTRTLPPGVMLLAGGIGLLFHAFEGTFWSLFPSLLPGIVVGTYSILTDGIGIGDAMLLAAEGSLIGLWKTIYGIVFSLLLVLPLAMYMVLVKKKEYMEIPFAPFLTGGFLCFLVLSGM